jgi:[ribosomal protein S5]-alanine N-acetyltransferase
VADNAASARVLEKVGLRREGRLREADWFKGRWWDGLIYGMLEDEWRAATATTAAART